jgi:hypothetical protein
MEHGKGGKGKEDDRASTISQNMTSAKVADTRICTESC